MKKIIVLLSICLLFVCCCAAAADDWTELTGLSGDPIDCTIIPAVGMNKEMEAILGEITEDDWSIGPEDAPLTLIEYADFQCPYCANAGISLIKLQAAYPDKIRFVYRHFPLSFHQFAPMAAYAADAAGRQGFFFDADEFLYSTQNEWSSLEDFDAVEAWLRENITGIEGLDYDQWAADFEEEELRANVNAAFGEVAATGVVPGTPTVFVNFNNYDGRISEDGILPYLKFFEMQQSLAETCPVAVVDGEHTYRAVLDTTAGEITIDLFNDAPLAVSSFVNLAFSGWYDGVAFHRVVDGFVAQAGDPSGLGVANAGYYFADEPCENHKYGPAGMVGMANSGAGKNSAQFFITYDLNKFYTDRLQEANPDADAETLTASVQQYLDQMSNSYTIFGQITPESMDALNAVTTDTVINKVTVFVK